MPREVLIFLAVGAVATLTHVLVATALQAQFSVQPQLANLGGYVSAVGLSYFGHGRLTFRVAHEPGRQAPRFIAVSLTGLVIGSALVEILNTRNGIRFDLTMGIVGATVAATTFFLSKFWVFAQTKLAKSK